jgi:hypothetical protein
MIHSEIFVMPGLVPGIHGGSHRLSREPWMAGTAPAHDGVDKYPSFASERYR